MLIACWSPKGGSGTTVVAASLAAVVARSAPAGRPGVVVADLAGDVPAVLGLPEPEGPGLAEWLAAGADVPTSALARLEVDGGPGGLRLLPWSGGPPKAPPPEPGPGLLAGGPARPGFGAGARRAEALVEALIGEARTVVADCGRGGGGAGLALAAAAPVSLMVLRPCYLALRRALAAPVRPSGVVLVSEGGRCLARRDVEEVLGVPVRAEVAIDPVVARTVDAGLLVRRLPRALERSLRPAVGLAAGRGAA